MVDNILGLVFGFARGFLVVSLAYFMIMVAVGKENQPNWLARATTKPMVEMGALWLAKVAPEHLKEVAEKQMDAAKQLKEDMANEARKQAVDIEPLDKYKMQRELKNIGGDVQKETGKTLDNILKNSKQY